jgi:thiamine biosynthesis protein ThiI
LWINLEAQSARLPINLFPSIFLFGAFLLVSVAFSEITIKGGNRRLFESLLINNMLAALDAVGRFRAVKGAGRVFLSSEADFDEQALTASLTRTFGVDYVTFPRQTKPDIEDITKTVLSLSGSLAGKAVRVDTKRSDKRFPLTSPGVNQIIGKALVDAGCSVDLDNPERTVHIEIVHDRALIYLERLKGPGGLPVGSSGKVLSLLSGGIDSPAASWLMMKRGCVTDFLHLHQSPANKDVMESKMARLVQALRRYSPRKLSIFAAPYTEFYKKSMTVNPRIELVLFRRFLFHLANRLAEKHGYKGVVTGDSVGQVASQTLDNLFASDEASHIPVFRPLAGFNKQEIVDLAKKIGTYGISIEQYKDCCSLVAHKNPSTKVPLALAKKAEAEMGIQEVVEKTLEQTEIFEL